MTRRLPLPTALEERPFSVRDARERGVTDSRLRAADLVVPTRGVRAHVLEQLSIPGPETATQRLDRLLVDMRDRAEQVGLALTPDQFFSHGCGLGLASVPLPYTLADARALHVSARRPAGQPRRNGVIGHRLQARPPARWTAKGLPIEHPARLWRQVGTEWELDDLIVAADSLILPRRRLLCIEDLWREVLEAGDVAGKLLTRALLEARPGAETAEETRLRLLLVRAGLPEPELNFDLRTSEKFIARLDLAYPRYRVAVEHDGRIHAEDQAQFAKDADRWDAIRATGWQHVRVLSHHMRPNPQIAIDKASRALFDAGWRPGRD